MSHYQPQPHGHGSFPMREVTKTKKRTSHGLHVFLSIITCGVWAITGWPIAWAWNTFGPRKKTVTRYR